MKKPNPRPHASQAPRDPESRSRSPDHAGAADDQERSARSRVGDAPLRGRLLSVSEAADQLGISDKSVRRAVQRGDLVAHRIGRLLRFSAEDLGVFVARRRMQAP